MGWTTDQLGRLALNGIHDSFVDGFGCRSRNFEITLTSRENHGLRTELHLSSVRIMLIDALWEGTIVNDIFMWNAHDVPEDFRLDPNAGWRHLLQGRADGRAEIDGEIERALKDLPPSGVLFSLVGSYGGSISILAAGVEIRQNPPA